LVGLGGTPTGTCLKTSEPSRLPERKLWYVLHKVNNIPSTDIVVQLKKRQLKKTVGAAGSALDVPASPLISPAVSRAFSPAPSDPPVPAGDEKKDFGDV